MSFSGTEIQRKTLTEHEAMNAAIGSLKSGVAVEKVRAYFNSLMDDKKTRSCCLEELNRQFYAKAARRQQEQYRKNLKALKRYPFVFRKDFPDQKQLDVRFYPMSFGGYLPFDRKSKKFGDYLNPLYPVVSKNYFSDLSKPVCADDVYSQYELEYLHDNVRASEDVGFENHLYLSWSSFETFCDYLQILDIKPLLTRQKTVFLFEEEKELYPIDFKKRFGITYSRKEPASVSIREINRLIWHSQLSAHNGGDFINEIFDSHPNLITLPSVGFDAIQTTVEHVRSILDGAKGADEAKWALGFMAPGLVEELFSLPNRSDKDIFVALSLNDIGDNPSHPFPFYLDRSSRIAPAIFSQPHFNQNAHSLGIDSTGCAVLMSEQDAYIQRSGLFLSFKYIKTFAPLRRITNSYAASNRFVSHQDKAVQNMTGVIEEDEFRRATFFDVINERMLSRNYLVDRTCRLYTDSAIIRFEDAKLYPEATFRAVCAFLDLPYTDSMGYCSLFGAKDPVFEGNEVGFGTRTVYNTYDEFANDQERELIEIVFQDAYAFYGYDFLYYDGRPVDEALLKELIACCSCADEQIKDSWIRNVSRYAKVKISGEEIELDADDVGAWSLIADDYVKSTHKARLRSAEIILASSFRFKNDRGMPLSPMPLIAPDPQYVTGKLYR